MSATDLDLNVLVPGAVLELPNGIKWTRRFGSEDEEWTREGGALGKMDFDFSLSVVRQILDDLGLFTPGEVCLITYGSQQNVAEMVADILEKRAQRDTEKQ